MKKKVTMSPKKIIKIFSLALTAMYISSFSNLIYAVNSNENKSESEYQIFLPKVQSSEYLKSLIKNNGDLKLNNEKGKALDNKILDPSQSELSNTLSINKDSYDSMSNIEKSDSLKIYEDYIYKINKNKVEIVKVLPKDGMELVSTINYTGKYFIPVQIMVDNKKLIVIGNYYKKSLTPSNSKNTIGIFIYDITDKKSVREIRSIDIEGEFITAKRIEDKFYLISSYVFNYYAMDKDLDLMPKYKDSYIGKDYLSIEHSDIYYMPGFTSCNYMNVLTLDLNNLDKNCDIFSYLGSGQNIYVSDNNVYVAINRDTNTQSGDSVSYIYKFGLKDGGIKLKALNVIPGKIFNQGFMDEYKDDLRLVTMVKSENEDSYKKNLYILNKSLEIVSRVEDIAFGANIKTIKFFPDRIYISTLKDKNPLFAIDLKDKKNPQVLGYLKTPEFARLLYPYDDTHWIGIGYSKKQIIKEDDNGNRVKSVFIDNGMKISIFNFEDVNNIKEQFVTKIGDRGTYSEVLNDSQAILINKENNTLVLPVTVMEFKDKVEDKEELEYGDFVFQGAYIYNIDVNKGINLKGKVTHMSEEELSPKNYLKNSDKSIQKILEVRNNIYTISNKYIFANDAENLKEQNILQLYK